MPDYKIIITGSSGFIASYLAEHLSKKFRVILLTTKKRANTMQWKLGQNLPLENLDNTIIFHLGFDVKEISKNFLKDNINYTGTMKIIEQSQKFKNCIFFQFSSQTASAHATSNYGRIKYLIDNEVKNINSVKIIKPGMVYDNDKSMIVSLIKKLVKFKIFPLISNKKNIQIIYINELIKNIEILCNKNNLKNYNFGATNPINLKEFVTLICKNNNLKIPYFIFLPEKTVLKLSKLFDIFFEKLLGISINERLESLINLEVMDTTNLKS